MSDTAAKAPEGKAKGSKKNLFIIIGAVVLLGGGGGAYWMRAKAAETAKASATKGDEEGAEDESEDEAEEGGEKGEGGIAALDPFVVNLADPSGSRFLRVSLSLVLKDEEKAKELEENAVAKARIRSAILELLAQQSADPLITPEGKDELKKAIAEKVKASGAGVKVTDVLFSEFVVQF